MRTVDPTAWYKSIRKPPLNLARPMRFGKKPEEVETKTRSFHYAMKEYWQNCTVCGIKYINDGKIPALVRYSYACLLFLLVCFGLLTLSMNAYQRANSEPSTVAERDGIHSVRDVPFPAVGLCSNNVVSTRALKQYTATLVATKQYRNQTYSETAIAQNLAHLGHLLSMSVPQVLDTNFMGFLASLDPRVRVASLMRNFAPSCSSMLVRCSWKGQKRQCNELFQTRATPLGHCCVFNSRYHPQDIFKLPQFLDVIGEDYGLSVVVQQDVDDVSFFRRASHDIDVLIFDGSDYPLLEGGGARLYPAEWNASVYLSLSASMHYPEEGLNHDIESLRCRSRRFSGPQPEWSHAWCLAECRRRSVEALCACRLHTLPPPPARRLDECALSQLHCLNKHREKLLYYYPRGPVTSDQEVRNAQDCSHCAPDCARAVYSADVTVARHSLDRMFKDQLLKNLPLQNVTIIKLYYTQRHIKSYVFQSNSRWYEKFVHMGSEWALIVGASVVSLFELVFHCSLRWRHHCRPRT